MKIKRRNDLSLRLLEVFGTMMLHKTTVATATELGISQPSVSTAIKQLEDQLGFALFERQKKRMIATSEARSLFQEIEPLFEQLRGVESRVRELRGGTVGKLRIMATPPLGHSVVPVALRRFLATRPGVTVQYDVRRLENVSDAVAIGAVDVGLCLGLDSHPGVDVRVLRTDRMVAMIPPGHPLESLPEFGPEEAYEHGFIGIDRASRIGQMLQAAFDKAHTPYEPQVEVRYCHTAAVLAQSGIGVAIVDRYTGTFLPNMDLVSRTFRPAIPITACLLTRPGRPMSRLVEGFCTEFETALQG
ncbi:LysR substrate-binding domain-containing protein [Puniceibacterium sp. IMCC21224]|uniref:LysR substrate-binding domain-containing protein n=1 Tax=Puniceibacterium sp. IMCC21224 TaxID=1618204 RepID=UPI00065D820A|nr:LysR substrate-binding domain-containing protein [Puniceibacterium sp. IMCC21224]KMK65456.1 transcriptional regulator [Puniceibacterium sp. IMCC21224]